MQRMQPVKISLYAVKILPDVVKIRFLVHRWACNMSFPLDLGKQLLVYFILARYLYQRKEEGKECTTGYVEKGKFNTALECANACGKEYAAFTFQKNCASQCLCKCAPRVCGLKNSAVNDFYLITAGKKRSCSIFFSYLRKFVERI